MKILVTGGAGLIGISLCKKLLDQGNKVVCVDNFITSDKRNIRNLIKHPNFKLVEHDICVPFPSNFKFQISNFKFVYHLACPTGVPNLTRLSLEMLRTCSIGTENVLELAKKHNAKLLFTSSSEVYGDPKEFPQTENYTGNVDPTAVRSPYEEGKRFSESLVISYVRKYKIDAKIARVFNAYGPYSSKNETRVISSFLRAAKQGKPLKVSGKGKQTRTFCYVDDLVEGLILIMKKGKKGEVYNLGSDEELKIIDLAKLIIKITNSKSKIKFAQRPSHDHNRRLPDLSKVKKLGWKQATGIKMGLGKIISGK